GQPGLHRGAGPNSIGGLNNGEGVHPRRNPSNLPHWIRNRCAMPAYNILLMGASYGSLLASKLLFGGHSIHLVCLPAEADLINAQGLQVPLPGRSPTPPHVPNSPQPPATRHPL